MLHTRVADKGFNPKRFPARGILGMFMNDVLQHFHLQLVSLYTRSDLWLNSLFLQLDFPVNSGTCSTKKRSRRSAEILQEVRAAQV